MNIACIEHKCIIEGCAKTGRNRGFGKRGKLCEAHHRKKYPRNVAYMQRKRRRDRLMLYGLSSQDYMDIIKEQGNNCSICGNKLNKPYIDHCHTTQAVRGVLCNKCNWGLGMFNDDIDLLASAVSYLINNEKRKEIA